MATPDYDRIKEETTPPAMDDPMEWTIHEVIPWLNNFVFGKDLETTFRVNDVDGHVLLNHFNNNTLKTELGIESFGKRARLLDGIKLLQGQSAKYLANHEEQPFYKQSPRLKSHTPTRVPSSSDNPVGDLSPLPKIESNKDSAMMLFTQLRLEDNEKTNQSDMDTAPVGAIPQPDEDTPMIDDNLEEGDWEDDKSGGSDDESLGDNDSGTELDVEEDAYEEEEPGDLDKTMSDSIRALVGLSSAIPRRNPLPTTPFTPLTVSQQAAPINILQPRRKGESLPVIAGAMSVLDPVSGAVPLVDGSTTKIVDPQPLLVSAPSTAIITASPLLSASLASTSSQTVDQRINILQPRRKGEPRPINAETSVTLAPVSLPNITPPSPAPTTPLSSHIITPKPMSPLQTPTPVSNLSPKNPPASKHAKTPRRLWSKLYLPSHAVPESTLFFAPNSADEFGGPDPWDDLSADRTAMVVWRGSKFRTGRAAFLGEHRVEQRRMLEFLRRPWPLVEVEEGEEKVLVYKPLRTHAEKEQARKRRRVDPEVIRIGLAKERMWDGGWKRAEDDVPVVVLRVGRTEEGEEVVTTTHTTWNKVKPREISQQDRAVEVEPEEELQSTSTLLFTDGMLEDLQKRWMRPGAGDEYAEEAGVKPDAEGFLKPLDESDDEDFEAAISQGFLRELEMEDHLQRRANMSPEERMQEKERLAKAAGKTELTRDEVEAEINLCIREFEDNWNKTKAPKIERKKYNVWRREQGKLKFFETELENLKTRRLPKLVDELLANHYLTIKEAHSLCSGFLYQTLALRCELEWKVAVLRGEKPDKPPPREKVEDNSIDRKGKKKATTVDRKAKYSGGESEHDENDYTSESSMGDFIDDSEMVIEEDVEAASSNEAESPREIHDQVILVTPKPNPKKRVMPSWNEEQWARLKEKKAREAAKQVAGVVTNNERNGGVDVQDSPVVEKESNGIVVGPDSEDMERVDTDVDMLDIQDVQDSVDGNGDDLSGLAATESVGARSAETMDDNIKTPASAASLSSAKDGLPLIVDRAEDGVLKAEVASDLVSPQQKLPTEKRTPAEEKNDQRSSRAWISPSQRAPNDYSKETAAANKRRFLMTDGFKDPYCNPDDSTDEEMSTPQSPSSSVITKQDTVSTSVSALPSSHLGTTHSPITLSDDEGSQTKIPRMGSSDTLYPHIVVDDNKYYLLPVALKVRHLIESKPPGELYRLIIAAMKKQANDQQSSKVKALRHLYNMFRWWTTKRSAKENQLPKHGKTPVSEMLGQQRFQIFCNHQRRYYAQEAADKLQNRPNVSTLSKKKKKRKLMKKSDFYRGSDSETAESEEEENDGRRTSTSDEERWRPRINNLSASKAKKRPAPDLEEVVVLTDDESVGKKKKKGKRRDSNNDSMDEVDFVDIDSLRRIEGRSRSLKGVDNSPLRRPKRNGFRPVRDEQENVKVMWEETTKKNKEVAMRAQVQKAQQNWDEKDHVVINIGHAESEDDIKIIPELGSKLKNHQKDGVQFLWKQIVMFRDYGCILAHNMGLGKTLQVIVFIFTLMREITNKNPAIPSHLEPGRTLILAPASVTQNWCNEIEYWINLEYRDEMKGVYQLPRASSVWADKLRVLGLWYDDGGILVLSYETFRDLVVNRGARQTDATKELIEKYLLIGPSLVIADEGHRIKNPQSSLSLTLKKFKTPSRVCLTGYPLQNNLVEYWTMIDWVRPGYLGDISSFRNRYKNPIENVFSDSTPSEVKIAMKQLFILKSAIGDLIQRKDASILHKELKKKTEFVLATRLTDLQRIMTHGYIEMSQNNSENSSTFFLKASHLRSIANHPYVFKSYISADKQRRAKNVVATSTNGNGESAIDPVDIDGDGDEIAQATVLGDDNKDLQTWMQSVCVNVQDLARAEYSNKVPIVMKIIEHSKRIKDKVLLFSHQIPLLDYIQELLIKYDISWVRLDGNTAQQKRQELIDSFNGNGSQDVFLISAKAGSLGVNLVAANRVILLDVDWNPCHDDQAIARAYRYGQNKQVYVYRFQSYSSIEERIFQNNVQKMGLSSRVIDDKQKQREFTRAEITRYLRFPEENPQSRLDRLDEDTKKEIAMDPIMKDIVEQSADKIVDIRLVNSYLLDLIDKNEVLTEQEIEECEQEVLKYKQGGLAAGKALTEQEVLKYKQGILASGGALTEQEIEQEIAQYLEEALKHKAGLAAGIVVLKDLSHKVTRDAAADIESVAPELRPTTIGDVRMDGGY